MSDGRNIDSARGTLSGEGAQQRVRLETEPYREIEPTVFRSTPSHQAGFLTGDAAYYDRPSIKKSVWTWMIPAYYYTGGVTGAAAVLGAAATMVDRDGLPAIAVQARYIAVTGATVSTVLLIADLGRPERFLHMLRVFRPTSPMSVGSWILSFFGTTAEAAALAEFLGWKTMSNMAGVASGFLGLGLAGYTGVLVANTVVPLWQQSRQYLPVLFLSSATASAASVFDLIGARNEREHRAVQLFGIAGKIGELSAATALERELDSTGRVGRPLRDGFSGFLWQTGKALSATSLALSLIPSRSRKLQRAIGVCGTLGAICIRFGIHYAGQRSAMDPRATFHQQRLGEGAYAVTGRAAVTGPDE